MTDSGENFPSESADVVLTSKGRYYYAANDAGAMQHPFCPRCYDAEPSKRALLNSKATDDESVVWQCSGCGTVFQDKPSDGLVSESFVVRTRR